MHKTIGRSAQPNIGSKKKSFLGRYPRPHRGGLPSPLKPPMTLPLRNRHNERGGSAPPLTPRLTMWASRRKNITKPNTYAIRKSLEVGHLVLK